MGWITTGYHFVSSIVQCSIDHSAEIISTGTSFVKCIASKFFV